MGESLPLPVVRRVTKAVADAESARIVGASVDAGSGRIVEAVSVAVVTRISGAVLGADERALSGAVLGAVVVRVLDLVSGRVSALVSVADSALRRGGRKEGWPRKHVLRPMERSHGHMLRPSQFLSANLTRRVWHVPRRPQFLRHETDRSLSF